MSRPHVPRRNASDRVTADVAPGDDTGARFLAGLMRVAGDASGRIALAISGGPDSMALLTLAAAAIPGRIVAATFDHALRVESADEAAMVARHCAAIDVPHATLVADAPIAGASLQAQARYARYAALSHWASGAGAACLATAHHCDDQAETFLMRASHGSGVAGLAGIRATVEIAGITVVRPLLGWRRAELRAIVRRAGVPFVDDPANSDPRHDRTRFRHLLEANEWLDPPALAATAAQFAQTDRDLRALTDWLWNLRAIPASDRITIDVADLPREMRRRLVRRAIEKVRGIASITAPAWSGADNIEHLIDALEADRGATQAGVSARARGLVWTFREAPPRRSH